MTRHQEFVHLLVLGALLGAGAAAAQDGAAYLRTVEGYAEHDSDFGGQLLQAAANAPLGSGDRLSAAPDGRLEAVLGDGTLARLGGDSALTVVEVGGLTDSGPILSLERGDLQVVRSYAGESLELLLGGVTAYLDAPSSYRVASDGYGSASLTVREGFAELATRRGSAMVRPGESAWLEGLDWPSIEIAAAAALDDLELWGEALDAAAYQAAVPYIEPELGYAAAPLADYGAWIDVTGRRAWRPYVDAGWRPYTLGSWAYSPLGLTWVSSEPWGWVPYHYGTWDLVPGFGWVWFPGDLYAPAWVYWYWGPTHVGWVPSGYYLSFYASHGALPWSGLYGWVGGTWDDYAAWTFCARDDFGHGHHGRFLGGGELARVTRTSAMPRGLLATDTRSLSPDTWRDFAAVKSRLLAAGGKSPQAELPDVTRFAVRSRTDGDAERWFLPKAEAARRAVLERKVAAARPSPGTGNLTRLERPGAVSVRPGSGLPSRPTAVSPRPPTSVKPPVATARPVPQTRPGAVGSSMHGSTSRPPVLVRPPASSRERFESYRPVIIRPGSSSPSSSSGRPPLTTRPPAASQPTAGGRPPVLVRPPLPSHALPQTPGRSTVSAPSAGAGRSWTPPPASLRPAPEVRDSRPVVQRVLEDIRARRETTYGRPQPPANQGRSWSAPGRGGERPQSPPPPRRGSSSSSQPSSRKPPRG